VAPGLTPRRREEAASLLDVDLLVLTGRPAPVGYRALGQAVCAVLDALDHGPCRVDRLGAAGALAGLWGEPLRVDSATGAPRRQPFRATGTTGPPRVT
jgi:hypothetical protein